MVKIVNWKDRLAWAAALRLPDDRLTFFLMLLIKEADKHGKLPLLARKLHGETGIDPAELQLAVDRLLVLGLLRRDGVDDRFAEPADRYELMHGAKPDSVQLTLGMHAMISAIENLEHITDRQQLALEKLVIRHYDWLTGLVTATTSQLMGLSGRWSQQKSNEVLEDLLDLGYLRRAPGAQRGYGRTAHRYILEIRTDSREIPYKSTPDSREIPYKSTPDSREIPYKSTPDSREIPYKSTPDSREIPYKSTPHPYTLDSPETLLPKTPPPPPPGGGGQECSNFLGRLRTLDEALAFELAGLAALEVESGVGWHETWADRAIEDLDQIIEQGGAGDPAAVLIVRWRARLRVWDFSRPAPPQIDRQPRGRVGNY